MSKPRLIEQTRQVLRTFHYSMRTEENYVQWIKRFIFFHNKRHPKDMGKAEVSAFLTHLAVNKHVAASTQNQALSAILFLYKRVPGMNLDWIDDVVRAKRPKRLPVVLSKDETRMILGAMRGTNALVAKLLYGTGMRLMEAVRLRVQDVDFSNNQIVVRSGKGNKDRYTTLPSSLIPALEEQLSYVRVLHEKDLAEGFGRVQLPFALDKKYPNAGLEYGWQFLFSFI